MQSAKVKRRMAFGASVSAQIGSAIGDRRIRRRCGVKRTQINTMASSVARTAGLVVVRDRRLDRRSRARVVTRGTHRVLGGSCCPDPYRS